jgi:hypothetical protein
MVATCLLTDRKLTMGVLNASKACGPLISDTIASHINVRIPRILSNCAVCDTARRKRYPATNNFSLDEKGFNMRFEITLTLQEK